MGKCKDCKWAEIFTPRTDEKYNMGCTYPRWEGYTSAEDSCITFSVGEPADKREEEERGE